MKELFLYIKTQLETIKDIDGLSNKIKFIHIWNNQTHWIEEGQGYDFLKPAVFIEFVNAQQIVDIGGGVQQYDPLEINLHIIHQFMDASDGTLEQNLDIFDLKQLVYAALQTWHCQGSGPFTRISEEQDYDHPHIYHFIQTFRTSYVDSSQAIPIGGYDIDPTLDLVLTPVVLPQST